MFEKLFSYRQIDDLRKGNVLAKYTSPAHDRRALFRVAVIDDRPFTYEQNLKALGYRIDSIGDIKSINEVDKYTIILCDLQGVGRFLNEKGQGSFIIDEIKRRSPEKYVIAYTGGSLDDNITIKAQEEADFFLKKDQDIDDWRDRLDHVISQLDTSKNSMFPA